MIAKTLAWASTIAVAALFAPSFADEPGPKTSLVLITLDTTRADRLGCYGHDGASTPNLDRLARKGVRFDLALSPTPLTLPSHATLMSGLVPRRHGARDNALYALPGDVPVLAEVLRSRGYDTAAAVSSYVLDRGAGLSRGFSWYDDGVRVGERSAFNYEERAASQTTDAVVERLRSLEPPFFLWVHYFDPHLPYVPPQPFRTRFDGRPYDGEIAFMDHEIGRLLEAVRSRVPAPLIVAAGDHGEGLGDHGEAAHGVFLYQATQRVPLILSGPRIPAGKAVRDAVGLVDVAPTILDVLGLAPFDDTDGRSLVPRWSGSGNKTEAAATYEMETLFPKLSYGWAALHSVVSGKDKYIEAPRPELYDLRSDPGETRNLVADRPEDAASLAAVLAPLLDDERGFESVEDPELAERRMRLEALGYVGGSRNPPADNAIDPKDGIVWLADLETGRRAVQTGRPGDCIAPLERLLERNPQNVPAWLTLASCRLAIGDAAAAVAAARTALEIHPVNDLVHFNLANALAAEAAERPEAMADAVRHYRRALEINPRRADVYLNLASVLVRAGDLEGALTLLRRADADGVRDPDLAVERAVLELKNGDVGRAEASFREAVALNPRDAEAVEALARITARQGRFRDAALYYSDLLELRPSPTVAKVLGRILMDELGDRDGARRAFRRALQLMSPDDPDRDAVVEVVESLSEGGS